VISFIVFCFVLFWLLGKLFLCWVGLPHGPQCCRIEDPDGYASW